MSITVCDYDRENLLVDAKTLDDISKILVIDERFKVLPSVLKAISKDIDHAMRDGGD